MNPSLHSTIQDRLLADEDLDPSTIGLVDAACEGDEKLSAALAELDAAEAPPQQKSFAPQKVEPPGAYVSKLTVAGFRGVGPQRTLSLKPGPGLTLLLGRNGSGKSSFAEGLETLLTGECRRWTGRPKEWQEGWKNLHVGESPAFVEASFTVEGGEPVTLRRSWKADAKLDGSELRVRRGADKLEGLEALGWTDPLATFRPFLSYSELGALLNKPSELYDKLKAILGLEEVATAIKRLTAARKSRADRESALKDARKRLVPKLEALAEDDPRAARCHAAIQGRKWDLDELEAVVLGQEEEDHDDAVRLLRALTQLTAPSMDEVSDAVAELRSAIAAQAALAGTSAAQNAKLAEVLEKALHYCDEDADTCPVCEGPLGSEWQQKAHARLEEAGSLAKEVAATTRQLDGAQKALRKLIRAVPPVLERTAQSELGLSTEPLTAWREWAETPADPSKLCDHAEGRIVELHAALESFVPQAKQKLEELESVWRPVALEAATWLEAAREVEAQAPALKALKGAETWLKNADADLRDARFEPISERSQEIWTALRQQSNVDLARVKLEGKGTKRHVELNVSVDGQDGVAVSVMSQGELNALALSLFLPRMTLSESPFHFLIIDDPVQAMDPHKVDGLARVLEKVAKTRQVIVLTHDARLYEAVRRLGIEATAIDVQRRAQSVVELSESLDPVQRHFRDAYTVIKNEQTIGPKMAGRLVPGFCRLAMEAACMEAIRRRRLGRGDAHVEVEEAIENAKGLHPLTALAVFDDVEKTGDVFSFLNNKLGKWAGDAFRDVKEGSHGGYQGRVDDLLSDSRKIAKALQEVA